jgi:hypothetical protein
MITAHFFTSFQHECSFQSHIYIFVILKYGRIKLGASVETGVIAVFAQNIRNPRNPPLVCRHIDGKTKLQAL